MWERVKAQLELGQMPPRKEKAQPSKQEEKEMIAWADGSVNAVRLRTYRDEVPGGFLAALAPARIDWKASGGERNILSLPCKLPADGKGSTFLRSEQL